eukprot:TRINITY_DN5275_c0_g1_i1.p1 TRINITY_DN5275_c0_g1~~TRINITY_DN5275_c0_g1_i1.p1  ORF type:complete len:811 (+),score=140.84 TRINITY_DN5275_c0_g1_i1:48-2435(+)
MATSYRNTQFKAAFAFGHGLTYTVAIERVKTSQGSAVRLPKAELELLGHIEVARDLMLQALVNQAGRAELQEVFGGDCSRIARLRAICEDVEFSEMNQGDQRVPTCLRACESVEKVLVESGDGVALRRAQSAARALMGDAAAGASARPRPSSLTFGSASSGSYARNRIVGTPPVAPDERARSPSKDENLATELSDVHEDLVTALVQKSIGEVEARLRSAMADCEARLAGSISECESRMRASLPASAQQADSSGFELSAQEVLAEEVSNSASIALNDRVAEVERRCEDLMSSLQQTKLILEECSRPSSQDEQMVCLAEKVFKDTQLEERLKDLSEQVAKCIRQEERLAFLAEQHVEQIADLTEQVANCTQQQERLALTNSQQEMRLTHLEAEVARCTQHDETVSSLAQTLASLTEQVSPCSEQEQRLAHLTEEISKCAKHETTVASIAEQVSRCDKHEQHLRQLSDETLKISAHESQLVHILEQLSKCTQQEQLVGRLADQVSRCVEQEGTISSLVERVAKFADHEQRLVHFEDQVSKCVQPESFAQLMDQVSKCSQQGNKQEDRLVELAEQVSKCAQQEGFVCLAEQVSACTERVGCVMHLSERLSTESSKLENLDACVRSSEERLRACEDEQKVFGGQIAQVQTSADALKEKLAVLDEAYESVGKRVTRLDESEHRQEASVIELRKDLLARFVADEQRIADLGSEQEKLACVQRDISARLTAEEAQLLEITAAQRPQTTELTRLSESITTLWDSFNHFGSLIRTLEKQVAEPPQKSQSQSSTASTISFVCNGLR